MKIVLLPFLVIAATAAAQPAAPLKPLLDSILNIAQENALHRREVNWRQLRSAVYEKTRGVEEIDTLAGRLTYLFEALGDYHGGIQSGSRYYDWSAGKPAVKGSTALDSAIRKAPKLLTQRWGDIGYYRLPGGTTRNVQYVIQMLADSLCTLQPSTIKGWIIDLRLNTGGNVWFMLTPLAGLLGEGTIGGIKFTNGQADTKTYVKEGKVWGNGQSYEVTNPKCTVPGTDIPVVILTGPKTASSGEGVILAFKGRPHTIIIGEPTAGLTTNNNSYAMRPNLSLILATGYMKDRNGKHYTSPIAPDKQLAGGDDFFNMEKDQKIAAAKQWLSDQLMEAR